MSKTYRKIIFLDIDGVLNCEEWFKRRIQMGKPGMGMIDPSLVEKINEIVRATNAEVVISSSWGYCEDTLNALKANGAEFTPIDGTLHLHYKYDWACRGNEIHHWITYKSGIKRFEDDYEYVILDDDEDMLLSQKDNFIRTSMMTGITDEDVQKAIHILNRD